MTKKRRKKIKKEPGKIKKFLKARGPGWVTGASDDDPSGIGTYTVAGATYGLNMLWSMLFTYPLMVAVQEMCARIAMVTGKGIGGVIRQHQSKKMLFAMAGALLAANTINIGANIGAMAASMELIIDIPFVVWALAFTILSLVSEIFISYATYVKYLKWLTLSLFTYVVAGFLVGPDWSEVLSHLTVPAIEFNRGFLFVIVGVFGTTLSPYLYFWQASSEIEEEVSMGKTTIAKRKGATDTEVKNMRVDVKTGMFLSNFIAFFIMLTAAYTLFANGIQVESAADAAAALKPIAGDFASLLFALGIVGTGLLSIPVLAASASYAFTESFGWRTGLYRKLKDAHGFYGIIIIATLFGLTMNFIGVDPIKLLLYAAVLNGIIAPIILTFILKVANNKKIMGKWKNRLWSNLLGYGTVALMTISILLLFILSI